MLFSHIAQPNNLNPEWKCQSTNEHNEGVARLAKAFADAFGAGDLGMIMGLLHDKGKEQTDWQKYLQGLTGYNKEYAHVRRGPNKQL